MEDGNSYNYNESYEKVHTSHKLEDSSYNINLAPGKSFCAVMYANFSGFSMQQ